MTTPGVRQPVYPGSPAVQQPFKPVTVVSVSPSTRKAICRDSFGAMMEVRCDIMRAKGNLPAQGEQWIIDRQYGDWIFGAILNNTTKGVEIPQANVGGLPEVITAYDTRMTNIADTALTNVTTAQTTLQSNINNLEGRSIGKVTTKGDLLIATGTGAVDRRSVGTDGQVLVADSTQALGWTCRTPLALTAPLTGATTPARYVGGTPANEPVSGTFQTGDMITTQSGLQWICTAGGTPGAWRSAANEAIVSNQSQDTRLNALENRANKNEAFWKNMWYWSNGSVPANGAQTKATGYTLWVNMGGISLNPNNGDFAWTVAGRWSIGFQVDSTANDYGNFSSYLAFGNPNPLGYNPSFLLCRSHRASGFTGAGQLCQTASWTGWVESNALNVPWGLNFIWTAPSPAGATTASYKVWAEYLGPL